MSDPRAPNCPVILTDDLGHRWQTRTRSAPWRLGDGTEVQLVEGIAGGYLTSRLKWGEDASLPHFRNRKTVDRGPAPRRHSRAKVRAKVRYMAWLRADLGVPFRDWLRGRMYKEPT